MNLPKQGKTRSVESMLNIIFLVVLCLITLPAVFWAHHRLEGWPAGTRWITRGIITAVGLGFAFTMVFVYAPAQEIDGVADRILILFSAYGLAHVPPAVVLQLKHWRGLDREGGTQTDE